MVLRELASESNRSNAGQSEENEARNFKPELPEYPSKVGRGCASSIQQRTAFASPNCVLRDHSRNNADFSGCARPRGHMVRFYQLSGVQ